MTQVVELPSPNAVWNQLVYQFLHAPLQTVRGQSERPGAHNASLRAHGIPVPLGRFVADEVGHADGLAKFQTQLVRKQLSGRRADVVTTFRTDHGCPRHASEALPHAPMRQLLLG